MSNILTLAAPPQRFAIRTRRVPFFRGNPSLPLVLSARPIVIIGSVPPATPFGQALGFQALPGVSFVACAGIFIGHLLLIEIGKKLFGRAQNARPKSRAAVPAARDPDRWQYRHRCHGATCFGRAAVASSVKRAGR